MKKCNLCPSVDVVETVQDVIEIEPTEPDENGHQWARYKMHGEPRYFCRLHSGTEHPKVFCHRPGSQPAVAYLHHDFRPISEAR